MNDIWLAVKFKLRFFSTWNFEINPYDIQTKTNSFMTELGSKDTSIRCETEEKGGSNLFFMLFAAGVVVVVMMFFAAL